MSLLLRLLTALGAVGAIQKQTDGATPQHDGAARRWLLRRSSVCLHPQWFVPDLHRVAQHEFLSAAARSEAFLCHNREV